MTFTEIVYVKNLVENFKEKRKSKIQYLDRILSKGSS